MGRLIIVELDGPRRVIPHTGPLFDLLDREFPEGPGGRVAKLVRIPAHGPIDRLAFDAWEGVTIEDGETYALGLAPAGLEIPLWAVVVASVALSAGAAYLLRPKVPGMAGQEAARSVYSVGVKANEARLNAQIPKTYGHFSRVPEYATQPYREFVNNEEVFHGLFVLGPGKYQVDEIYLGSTAISSLPPGLVEWEVYLPDDHGSELGNVETDFGLHENVWTSTDVDAQELKPAGALSDSLGATVTYGSSNLIFNGLIADAQIMPGNQLKISAPSALVGTYTIASATSGSITITGTFPAAIEDETVTFEVLGVGAQTRGPFVTNGPGTLTSEIRFDLEWGGLYKQKDNGNFANMTVEVTATVQEIDDAGDDVGAPADYVVSQTGATNDPVRETFVISDLTLGRYKLALTRTDDQEIRARDASRTVWKGMRARLAYDNSKPRYGGVTLLAFRVRGAEAISDIARSQIRVEMTSILRRWGSDPEAEVAGGNLTDVMADIVTNPDYGAGQPDSVLHDSVFQAFRTEQSARSGFNGVFDTPINIWEALQAVAVLGRAEPIPRGFQVSLVTDRPKPQRASIVSPDNIMADTFKIQWAMFSDTDQDGYEVEWRVPATGESRYARFPTDAVRPSKEAPLGLADGDEADSMAEFLWRQFELRNAQISFTTSREALNWKRYDRVAAAAPWFNSSGLHGYVTDSDGLSVTLNRTAPPGALSVILRDQKGGASAVMAATANGTRTIALSEAPPFALSHDGSSLPTLAIFGPAGSFEVLDLTILEIGRPGLSTPVKAANYVPDLHEGLA